VSGSLATRRVTLAVGGQVFDAWTRVEIVRDLTEISGSFSLEYADTFRARRTLPALEGIARAATTELRQGQPAKIAIDNETVLLGWIDDVTLSIEGDSLRATVSGRDRTGDLVDCAAAPDGPAEYRNLTLTQIAERICAPFGIPVRAEVDVGAPFPKFSIDVAETAMSALEKAARQRAVLVVSDGIGGLVLTRGGNRRGPAPLRLPGNVMASAATLSWRDRFRDYIVKGQTSGAAGGRAATPALSAAAPPLSSAPAPAPMPTPRTPTNERRGIVMTGRARDEAVTRHRPKVASSKTQSGGVSVQEQADWMMRTARAQSDQVKHTVADWRAGDDARLWRTNELVLVEDRYAGLNGDMLISGVTFQYGEDTGHRAVLSITGPAAFDVLREANEDGGTRARGRTRAPALSSAAPPLTAGGTGL
jgi:prophage tail gpP-like protein